MARRSTRARSASAERQPYLRSELRRRHGPRVVQIRLDAWRVCDLLPAVRQPPAVQPRVDVAELRVWTDVQRHRIATIANLAPLQLTGRCPVVRDADAGF